MAWKTVNAAQSTDAQSQNAFRRFSNILMTHRNANGNIQYNPQDKSYRLVNDNGIFYSNGRFFSRFGAKGNYDINTGNFLKKKVNKPATSVKQQSSTGSKDIVSQATNPNYLYGYKEQVNKQNKIPTNSPATPTPTYNRSQTRDYMRSIGMNPYDYSGSERKALRTYLNNPGSMDSKYQPFIDQVQNQRTQKMVNSIGTNQLLKPETDTNKLNNQLVNLKFEKGGQMYKYSVGAQMVQPQQTNSQDPIDQIAQIAAESLQGDENSKQQLIQVLSNKEIAPKLLQIVDAGVKNQDKRAVIIAQAIKALQQGSTRKARLGAKLDYIKQSIGECPEGQEVVYFKKGGEICKICAGKKMQDGGKSDPIKNFKKKKDVAKQTYQRNPYTRGKSAKEIAEMQRRNRQEASEGKGENDANVAPWNYKKKKMK